MTVRSSRSVIAVVDDDRRILGSLEILLESADYAVHLFASGTALLESGRIPEIDCLITDIEMPGMDGFQLLRSVHIARPGLPIILITGHPIVLNESPAKGAGHFRLFKKPFDSPRLLEAVNQALAVAD